MKQEFINQMEPSFDKAEVECLLGNPTKAKKILGWKLKTSFTQLVEIMVKADYDQAKREAREGKEIEVHQRLII